MTQGASELPIVQFLNRLLDNLGFAPGQLAYSLGYRNGRHAEKGLRRLNLWLDTGDGYGRILDQIGTAFPAYGDRLNKAAAETRAIRKAEFDAAFLERCKDQEATFVPFLYAEGEKSIPSGITMFGISGGHERWTMIKVPHTILMSPLKEQLAALPELMLRYTNQYNGAVPFFGQLVGFKFVRRVDYFQFDADGGVVGRVNYPFRCSPCCATAITSGAARLHAARATRYRYEWLALALPN